MPDALSPNWPLALSEAEAAVTGDNQYWPDAPPCPFKPGDTVLVGYTRKPAVVMSVAPQIFRDGNRALYRVHWVKAREAGQAKWPPFRGFSDWPHDPVVKIGGRG